MSLRLPNTSVTDARFLGGRIPQEIETMAKNLKDLDHELFRKILKAVVNTFEGKHCQASLKSIEEGSALTEERLIHIFAGVYRLFTEAIRISASSLKQEAFKDHLRDLSIPEDFITDFTRVVFGSRRTALEAVAINQSPHLLTLEDFRWRVDVAISTSTLMRAIQPSILMKMNLSDGSSHCFEVSESKFQELRYNIALILKEMNDLEKRSVLKIQD